MVHGKQQKLQEQWQIVRTLYDSEDQLIDSMWNEAIQSKLFHSVCFDLTACTRNSSSSEYWAMKSRELQQHYGIVQQQEEPARDGSHICVFFLSNANNCSRNNKNHKEMRVHRTWAHWWENPQTSPPRGNTREFQIHYNTESTKDTLVSWQQFNLQATN